MTVTATAVTNCKSQPASSAHRESHYSRNNRSRCRSNSNSNNNNIVETWLNGIGLQHVWTNFESAGIVTPESLAELESSHFSALAVQSATDRRKLFFLVQRVKLEQLEQQKRNTNTIETKNANPKERVNENGSRMERKDAEAAGLQSNQYTQDQYSHSQSTYGHDDWNVDDDKKKKVNEQDIYEKQCDDKPTLRETAHVIPIRQSRRLLERNKETLGTKYNTNNATTVAVASFVTINTNTPSVRGSQSSKQKSIVQTNESVNTRNNDSMTKVSRPAQSVQILSSTTSIPSQQRSPSRNKLTSTSNPAQSPKRYVPQPVSSELHGNALTSYGHSATSIRRSTPPASPSSLRQQQNPNSISTVVASRNIPTNRVTNPTATTTNTKTIRDGPNNKLVANATLEQTKSGPLSVAQPKYQRSTSERFPSNAESNKTLDRKLNRSASELLDEVLNSDPCDHNNTFTRKEKEVDVPRNSGLVAPKRTNTTNKKSTRTGKPLSAVPADSVPPMSPLAECDLTSTLINTASTRNPVRNILISDNDDDDDNDDISLSSTNSRRKRMSRSVSELSGSSTGSGNRRRRASVGVVTPAVRATSNTKNGWKEMIAQLRERNETQYKQWNIGHDICNHGIDEEMRIRVVVRKRPMSRAEVAAAGDIDIIHPLDYGTYGRILVYQPRQRVDLTKQVETIPFAMDHTFDASSTNSDIYQRAIRNLIPTLFEGQWASIFAYGQTGSGKTFTMMGNNFTGMNDKTSIRNEDMSNLGLYYMAALDIFHAIKTPGFDDFTVGISMFEIYGGKLFDLLNDRAMVKCLEDSKGKVRFPGLGEHSVANPDELIALIEHGAAKRSTGTTSRNADSSRSHAVLQLNLHNRNVRPSRGGLSEEFSRLTFIDLAGSERGADTSQASRATRLEGAEINTSLLALKEVIRALATGDSMSHVPFRGSKLTQVLKESFVGNNGRSVMIACISPNIANCEQTLNTLRYADRVKERNPDTGKLGISHNINGNTKSVIRMSRPQLLSMNESSAMSDSCQNDADRSCSNNSEVLDELLATPQGGSDEEEKFLNDNFCTGNDTTELENDLVQELIATHKDAMTVMLDMIKEEMTLVNHADADRGSLNEYMSQIYSLQDEQLAMITLLREQLLQYRLNQAGMACTNIQDMRDFASVTEDDESFEDLRD